MLALLPSALHLDFFAAAKTLLLGTARVEVTLHFCYWTNENLGLSELIMGCEQDAILTSRLSEAESVSFPKAARRLGLDTYTFYTLIQRERVQAGLSPSGEFVIPNEELNWLLKKD